ncbi:MAG TPA: serine/threonine-protein kinase [Burkholderiaceae bacterium]|nr:serine/threonine-protein kinase [Burkholderiaceae bacterium]
MSVEPTRSDKLPGTVVIADFAERRAREMVRDEAVDKDAIGPGTKLGRYLIVERLGGGGMGVVYKAQDTELHRTVALKILPPHLCRHPEYLNRFRAEAQAHARLNSQHITTLFSLLELPAGEVLVLEYVEGQTLEQRLRGGPLEASEVVRIFDQALRAVEHAHSAGVVHRDLKPANIFLTREGRVKLMDFGVAKLMDQPELNTQRTMVGTLLYISPEQINGHSTDFRSDVYTLGVSLFEAVAGRLPFERRTDYALMHAHVQEHPPSPKEFQRSIPPALEAVIMKAIEKAPGRRFQSVGEFRVALLKTGLIERRHRIAARKADASVTDASQGAGNMRRRFGGIWLDAALIAIVVGFVYQLGIYPNKPAEQLVKAQAAPSIIVVSKAPKAVPKAAASVNGPRVPVDNAPTQKYDSLRDAWGN